eukprot:NODE_11201_length_467_cov_4.508721_g10546_i0.p1 GENE.NODE_11201_length_467_cov_4.508721_g10546_i0~~NODE_11201_length_467_cov_4.508721_g10546_i0.p1  ORF type:complete len:113 (+),score=23.83 NODE_11201_length_467_cov_4.508721_g10546_i0:35-373(+)
MSFKAAVVFDMMKGFLTPEVCSKVGVVFQFEITNANGEKKTWTLDSKNKPGSIKEGENKEATCTIILGDDDFVKLMSGQLDGMQAFMSGKMKIKGNMMQAQLLNKLRPESKL